MVNFVNGNLRPVKSDVDQELSSWYKDNSQVYVAHDHACWADASLERKVRKKRFGTVIRSSVKGLTRMMTQHAPEVYNWIMERLSDEQPGDTTEDDTRMG